MSCTTCTKYLVISTYVLSFLRAKLQHNLVFMLDLNLRGQSIRNKDKSTLRRDSRHIVHIFSFVLEDLVYAIFIRVKRTHMKRVSRVNWGVYFLILFKLYEHNRDSRFS